MTANELLLWLSARKQGSWLQFRAAVENLDLAQDESAAPEDDALALHQRVQQNLERLGHVEFDTAECENGWRAVPPVLALSPAENGHQGILCGARTLKLLERVEQAAAGLTLERIPCARCPDVIRLRAPGAADLAKAAEQAGVLCQAETPTALLSRLPPVDRLDGFQRAPLPASGKDWQTEIFVVGKRTMRWEPVTVRDANAAGVSGLFRFTRFQTPQYFLREGRETVKLPGAVGKYHLLWRNRRRVLRYDRAARTLTVRAVFRPPLLTERALILCSGFPPSLSVVGVLRFLTYRDVPEDVAALAAEVLKQDLI